MAASPTRAVRAARELLERERGSLPVDVEAIARRHAIVVRENLPADVSGMLVPLPRAARGADWAIVVNESDAAVRQRFTIAHELGHLILHRYSTPHADGHRQVRFRDDKSATGSIKEEVEANQFAAELLMPERKVQVAARALDLDLADPRREADAIREIRKLAKRFGVSFQALSFRIANLGLG